MGVELKSLCTGRPSPSPPSFPQHFPSIFHRLFSSSEHRSCPSQALPFAAIVCEAEPKSERSERARLAIQAGRMQSSAWHSPHPSQALWVSDARHLWRGTLQARYLEDSKSCFKNKEHKNFLGRTGVRRFAIWGEIVQRSLFLLHSHLPRRNPIVTRCPLEPLRLGIAPWPDLPISGSISLQPLLISLLPTLSSEPQRLRLRTEGGDRPGPLPK